MNKQILLVAAFLSGSMAHAQHDSAALSEVVVTANRFLQKQTGSGKVVTIIDSAQLARSSGRSLSELLNQQAGFTIIGAQNTLGTNQDLYLRGAGTGQTLILIDGVPAYDASSINTAFDLNHVSLQNVARIEIVKGAMSTLYGSDAVAGVINIITKKTTGRKPAAYGTISGGSFGTSNTVAGASLQQGRTGYHAQYSRLHSRGFSAAHDSSGTGGFDRDGYRQQVFSAGISRQLSATWLLKTNGQWSRYRTELDAGPYRDEQDFSLRSANGQLAGTLEHQYRRGRLVASYSHLYTDRKLSDDSGHVGGSATYSRERYTGRSSIAELYTHVTITPNLSLLAGADYRFQNTDQRYFSISDFGPFETKHGNDSLKMQQYSAYAAVFLQHRSGLRVEAGGRYNHHSVYGSNSTYTFNPSILVAERWKLFANLASAFKAPSLYQLFVIGAAPGAPLRPERSHSIDGGVEYHNKTRSVFARAVYFNRRVQNGIEFNLVNFTYFNNNRQRDAGLELEGKWQRGKTDVSANYTYVQGSVNTTLFQYDANTWSYTAAGDTSFNNLYRRPKHSANISVGVQITDRLYTSLRGRVAGKRLEPLFMGTPVPVAGYYNADLYLEYRIATWAKLFADLKNITDQRYFDVPGYNAKRFNFLAGFTLNR